MKRVFKFLMCSMLLCALSVMSFGCMPDADVASYNLSKDADMFKVMRRVVFYNGITGTYILSVEGKCSIQKDNTDNQLELIVKTGEDTYKKHYLGLSDNVTYFVEQLDPVAVDVYHYKVIFKPEVIVPDVDLSMSK